MTAAKASAISIPFCPPKARPASMSSSVMPVSRSVVVNMLLMIIASVFWLDRLDAWCWALGSGHALATGRCRAALGLDGRMVRPYAILPLPLQCPVERLVEGCSGFFVVRGRDLALFSLYLELEQFFFQRFEQHLRSCDLSAGRGCRGHRRGWRRWTEPCAVVARRCARLCRGCRGDCGSGLPFRDHPSADREQHGECAEDGPAILL